LFALLEKLKKWVINSFSFDFRPPSSPTLSFPRILVWGLACLVLGKLILTSQEEILAFYLPHDDLWQIRAAARAYWGGGYGPDKLYHLPVFPLFMDVVRVIGLPLRLALELFYCGSACLLVGALWRLGAPLGVVLISASALIFHPASFQLPNRCGAEILLTPLLMGAIATSLLWWVNRKGPNCWRYVFHASLWWALAWNVRKESIVLLPIFVMMFLFAILVDRQAGWQKSFAGIALMLCFCFAVQTAIKTANLLRWGLFATSVQTAPGFKSAVKSLQSIRPKVPLAYIPVPVEVRQRAYAVSPAFAKLKPFLDGDAVNGWTVHSRPFTDSKGLTGLGENEVSAGWFYWAFYDAVIAAGYGAHPGEADRFLAQIGTEINRAISDGRLPGRWVPMTMVDPSWSTWMPHLLESLQLVGRTFVTPAVPKRPPYDRAAEDACGADFDKGANRRSYLTGRFGKAEAVGWAFAAGGTVQSVEVISAGSLLGRASLDIPRPDVDPTRSVGFRVPLVVNSIDSWQKADVVILLSDGRKILYPISKISTSQIVDIPLGNTVIHFAIDLLHVPGFKVNRLWVAQKYLESCYLFLQSWLLWPGVFAALVLVIISTIQRRPIDLAITLIAVTVASRLLFFAILDASAWPGDQPRYLYAVYPLFSLLLVLVYARLFSLLSLWKAVER